MVKRASFSMYRMTRNCAFAWEHIHLFPESCTMSGAGEITKSPSSVATLESEDKDADKPRLGARGGQ